MNLWSIAGVCCAAALVSSAIGGPPDNWTTVAERTKYESTSSYDETMDYLEALDRAHEAIRLVPFGRSAEGRDLPLVIVSARGVDSPEAARRSAEPIVMVQSAIHAGEIDGKEASLMLLRDVVLGRAGSWLEGLTLLVVPIYNVDGHERVSPYHRPNQDGPRAGMGFRTTADGHDLNRDHLKLATPEARALAALIHAWRPHLHVDNHVTNGSDHGWVLTWTRAEAPQLAGAPDAWAGEQMRHVVTSTEALGHRVGPYVELIDENDPAAGIDSRVSEPRYATGYWPLLNRPSILIETHAHEPFRDRVRVNYDFLRALLDRAAAAGPALVSAVREAERQTVERGAVDAPRSRITLEWSGLARRDEILFRVHDWYHEPSTVLGKPLLHYRRGRLREIEVPWIHRSIPELTLDRPRGYLILPGWPVIERALEGHGLEHAVLARAVELEVETLRLEELSPEQPGRTYQGLTRMSPVVERELETRRLPAGTLWVRADQPDFEIAAQLLEPEAPDSLVRWGLVSQVVERKEYIDPRLLERLARKLLDQDEDVEEDWEEALEDPTFAADPAKRSLWWYRRTLHWDETVGLVPVMRLLDDRKVATLPLEPPR